MEKNLTNLWVEMGKYCAEPLMAFNELNSKAFQSMAKGECLNGLLHAKKAEDVVEAQRNLLAEFNGTAMNYMQEATNIALKSAANFTKKVTSLMNDFSQVSEAENSKAHPIVTPNNARSSERVKV